MSKICQRLTCPNAIASFRVSQIFRRTAKLQRLRCPAPRQDKWIKQPRVCPGTFEMSGSSAIRPLDYSFCFTFCSVYGTTLCWLWLLIMAGHLMMVVTTGLFVVKKEASGREGSEEWLLFMEICCRGLESRAMNFFTWLTGTSILQVCPHWLLQILRSCHSFRSLKCSVRVVNCPFLISRKPKRY